MLIILGPRQVEYKWTYEIQRDECQEQKNLYKEHLQYKKRKGTLRMIWPHQLFEPCRIFMGPHHQRHLRQSLWIDATHAKISTHANHAKNWPALPSNPRTHPVYATHALTLSKLPALYSRLSLDILKKPKTQYTLL